MVGGVAVSASRLHCKLRGVLHCWAEAGEVFAHNNSLVIRRSVAANPVRFLYSCIPMVAVTMRSDSTSHADCHFSSVIYCP